VVIALSSDEAISSMGKETRSSMWCRSRVFGAQQTSVEMCYRPGGIGARLPFRWPGRETGKTLPVHLTAEPG